MSMTKKQTYLYTTLVILILAVIGLNIMSYQLAQHVNTSTSIDATMAHILLWDSTLPRIVMAILVGGSLGLATLLLQQITHNPLASESTLAISSGAQLALLSVSIFFPSVFVYVGGEAWAIIGAVVALVMVLFLALKNGLQPLRTLLVGMVLSLFFGAVASVLMVHYPEESKAVMKWGAGSLIQDSWHDVIELLITNIVAFLGVYFLIKPLQILDLNDAQASSLGVSVKTIRLCGLAIVALLVAITVSLVGMIGFIGLTAATIVRQCQLKKITERIVVTYALSGLLLLLADTLMGIAQLYTSVYLPVGAATAFLGAPILLYVLFKSFKQQAPTFNDNPIVQRISRVAKTQLFTYLGAFMLLLIVANMFVKHDTTGYVLSHWSTQLVALRLPRLLTAFTAGLMLSVCGLILQRVAKNPLASPELLGVNSGAAMMMLIVILFTTLDKQYMWIAGIVGAVITLAFIIAVNYRHQLQPEKVLISGLAVAAFMDAFLRLMMANGDPRAQFLLVWLSGSTYYSSSHTAFIALGVSVVALIIALMMSRVLTLLSIVPSVAQSLGLSILKSRIGMLTVAAVLSAIATLLIGPLSFIGLIAPHLARVLGCQTVKAQLTCSCLIGIDLMLSADWLASNLLFPYEIPTSLVATVIGGGLFLALIKKV